MKSGTQRFVTAIFSIVVLAAAFVVFFELVQPAYQDLQTLKAKAAGEQAFLDTENKTIAQAQKIANAYQNQADAQNSVNAAFPIGENISGAVAQIFGIAQTNALNVQNLGIAVLAPSQNQSILSVGANGIVTAGTSIVKPTGTVQFALAGTGTYESFKNFLSQLETNVRIFDVTQVSIQPGQASLAGTHATSSVSDFFSYTVNIAAYYQAP